MNRFVDWIFGATVKGDHYQKNCGFIRDLRVGLTGGVKIFDGAKLMTSVLLKTTVYCQRELKKLLMIFLVDQRWILNRQFVRDWVLHASHHLFYCPTKSSGEVTSRYLLTNFNFHQSFCQTFYFCLFF